MTAQRAVTTVDDASVVVSVDDVAVQVSATGPAGPAGPPGADGAPGPPGTGFTRQTTTFTTASLAANAGESGTLTLAKGYRLLKLMTTRPARVRLYTTAAKRDADVARPIGTAPTGDHGCLLDLVTTAGVGTRPPPGASRPARTGRGPQFGAEWSKHGWWRRGQPDVGRGVDAGAWQADGAREVPSGEDGVDLAAC